MPEFSQDLFSKICERIADGESLRTICEDADMPSKESVRRWVRDDEALRAQYARAREQQADTLVDEMLGIADDAQLDPQDRRVRIDTRKWIAGKMRPKVYGDKVATEISGPDGGPVQIEGKSARDIIASRLDGIAAATKAAGDT